MKKKLKTTTRKSYEKNIKFNMSAVRISSINFHVKLYRSTQSFIDKSRKLSENVREIANSSSRFPFSIFQYIIICPSSARALFIFRCQCEFMAWDLDCDQNAERNVKTRFVHEKKTTKCCHFTGSEWEKLQNLRIAAHLWLLLLLIHFNND